MTRTPWPLTVRTWRVIEPWTGEDDVKRGSGFARWMKANPATPRPRNAWPETNALATALKDIDEGLARLHARANECDGVVKRHGQDEYRCARCGVLWAVDEPRPPCQSTNSGKPKGGNHAR